MAILPHVEWEPQIDVSSRIIGLNLGMHQQLYNLPCLMSHTKFFSPDSVSSSACSPVIKSAVHPKYPLGQSVNAENIRKSSNGMLNLKRIGIVY
ncbi:MAG: hypothetical protein EZS28_001444 [Streblomastix strix]|uniref:Uncharacterized protein n=1 Tax=Streblomastix strix TaxID=222440 RepID=A0A5J4X744_9EUKA|nr:MAG: hypothetical protein EZS28_001444 [Streblomastix strix]